MTWLDRLDDLPRIGVGVLGELAERMIARRRPIVRRIRAGDARPALESLLDHECDTIRRRARDALARLP